MSIVDSLNTLDLYRIFANENDAFQFSYQADLLYDGGDCQSKIGCDGKYQIVKDASEKTGFRLKCDKCGKTKSLFF